MGRFWQYLTERGIDTDNIFPDHEKPLGDMDQQDNTEGLMRVLRLAVEEHYQEIMNFLHELALKDPKIQDELSDMSRNTLNKPFRKAHKSKMPNDFSGDDGNVVVPHDADRASANEFGPA